MFFFYVSVLNAVFYADAPTSHHALSCVPADSPSRGGDAAVYVFITETNRACSLLFLFYSCVYFCLYGPFNCNSFHTFSRQLSAFSFCSSGLISALLVLSPIYLSLYESLLQL